MKSTTKLKLHTLLGLRTFPDYPLGGLLEKVHSSKYGEPWSVVAHAGGGTQYNSELAVPYTNSYQSIEDSIHDGKFLIELDLTLTSDNKLVAVHSWSEFKARVGFNDIRIRQQHDDKAMSYKEFISCQGEYGFELLDIDKINKIFADNPSLILVVDKLKQLNELVNQFDFPERVIVEVFDVKGFKEAKACGFNNIMLNIDIKNKRIVDWIKLNRIKAVTFNAKLVESNRRAFQNALKIYDSGVVSIAYTTNDDDFIQNHLGLAFSAFYTDHWSLNSQCSKVKGGNVTY